MHPEQKLFPNTILIAAFLMITINSRSGLIEPKNPQEQISYVKVFNDQNNGRVLLNAPIVSQKPELYNGCEICSLAMLLQYSGIKTGKMTLAAKIKKDMTPLVLDKKGRIVGWGNPDDGFVGDITGRKRGYGAHTRPVIELLEKYLPGRSSNLTGQPFEKILRSIDSKRPVILWVTINFKPAHNFKCWKKNGKTVRVTFNEHAVLLVGYDRDYCYINNPYNGVKNQKVNKEVLAEVWKSMGGMAVSYR